MNPADSRDPESAPDSDAPLNESGFGTQFILRLTVLTFLGQLIVAYQRKRGLFHAFLTGGNEIDLLRFGAMPLDADLIGREPWLLLSSLFVHYGILHIGMNMLAFGSAGRAVEPAIGAFRLLFAYVCAGLCGSLLTLVLASPALPRALSGITRVLLAQGGRLPFQGSTAGASGAVFGIMGLTLGWFLRKKDPRWKTFAVEVVLFSLLFGFAINATTSAKIAVNNAAHVGGLLCGIAFGLVYAKHPQRRSPAPSIALKTAAILSTVLCVGSLVLAQFSPRWRIIEKTLQSIQPEKQSFDKEQP